MRRVQWFLATAAASLWLGIADTAYSQQQNPPAAGQAAPQQSGVQQQAVPGQVQQQRQGAAAADAQAQAGIQFGGINRTPWFANSEIQQQLRLTPQQRTQLQELYQTRFDQFQQRRQQLDTQASLTAQQRLQQRRQLQQQFNRDFSQALDQNFRSAPFRERFNQLGLQYRGLDAFVDADVQQQLNITPAQQQQLDQLAQTSNERLNQLYQTTRDNPAELKDNYRELLQYRRQQLQEILNPNQLDQWGQMTGEDYAFPASVYFPAEEAATSPSPSPQPDRPGSSTPRRNNSDNP
jgi:hypothetical protein